MHKPFCTNDLYEYIQSTFNMGIDVDSLAFFENKKLNLLTKDKYNICIAPLRYNFLKNYEAQYIELVQRALNVWAKILDNKITFEIIDTRFESDLILNWTKANVRYVGMQGWEQISGYIKRFYIDVALIDSKNNIYDFDYVYSTILHEFGHFLGLGHSKGKNDIMNKIVPVLTGPSDNDKFVLKLIYSIGNKSYDEARDYIEKCISGYCAQNKLQENKDLMDSLSQIANIKKFYFKH